MEQEGLIKPIITLWVLTQEIFACTDTWHNGTKSK